MAAPLSGPRRSAYLWTFLALAAFYAVTQQRADWTYGWDGYCRYRMLDALLRTGSPMVDAPGFYPMFHFGASLAMLPLYLAGDLLGRLLAGAGLLPAGRDYAAEACFFFYGLVTAASVAALIRALDRLGVAFGRAIAVGLIYALATMAWPYAGEMQSEPLVALCLLGGFLGLLAHRDSGDTDDVARAGLWGALAILTRPEAIIVLFPMLAYFARQAWGRGRLASHGVLLLGTASLGILGVLAWNWLRFGSPFDNGYDVKVGAGEEDQSVRFTTPLLVGLFGQLFSSGKGAFWYNPVLWLALLGWPAFLRERRAEALACAGTILAALALYSKFWNWAGDASWGPRYILIPLPFAILPLAWLRPGSWGWPARIAAAAVLGTSLFVQALGTFVPIKDDYLPYKQNDAWRRVEKELALGDDNDTLLHYIPALSPLRQHWERFAGLRAPLRWFPYDPELGRRVAIAGPILAAACLLASLRAARSIREVVSGAGSAPVP